MADARSIAILKPGTYTDVRGTKVTFTRTDLAEIAASYDADSDPAPLVVGHPGLDAPAYGWVGRVELGADDVLRAHPSEIAPAFGEAVEAGHYRKVSPQLYPPRNPANPKPGRWYLQHVGFLGGAAPAIKGLGTVAFSQVDDADVVAITIEQEPPVAEHTPADTIALSEHNGQVATLQQEIDQLKAAARARDEADAAAQADARHNENVAFAEGLVTAGTLAPAAKDKVVAIMDELAPLAVVSFGEGDAAVEVAPLAAFRSLFDSAQPVIALGEHAPADAAVQTPTVVVSFAAPPGYSVAPDNAALHARAVAIQAENPSLSFWDAFTRARAEPAA